MSTDTPTILQQTRDGRLARPFLRHEAALKALARHVHDTYDAKEWGGMDQDTVFLALAAQEPFEGLVNIRSNRGAVDAANPVHIKPSDFKPSDFIP